jgi:23S rRNA (pseudouridine1915-N3)-methyltransferase
LEISVLAVGRLKAGPERELCERYLDRARSAGRKLGLRGFEVTELAEARAARPQDRIAAEETALLARLRGDDRLVALDALGDLIDSDAFAASLAKTAASSVAKTVFLIGGPDGLGNGLLDRSHRRLSFGRVTWPHQLVRVLLAEQLYRATTILSGHPYHRA